jgi:arylsulfatase A-like enzyme
MRNKLVFTLSSVIFCLAACNQSERSDETSKVSSEQSPQTLSSQGSSKPNIVIIYIDDLGYGDISSYGATSVSTPNIDRLANNGIKFTDAHSSAATCTPSRYSLLTGEHGFRQKAGVLKGDAPLLIPTDKPTLPKMLQRAGYTTGVVGKWHLGLGNGSIDWNNAVKPGPLEVGFDYSYLLPATGDRVPTVYLENHHIVNLDKNDPITVSYKEKVGDRATGVENPELLRYAADRQHSDTIINGVSRIGTMAGGESALWKDEEFVDVFTEKAINFIRKNKAKPFFLFHSYHDIHVPRLPHPRFKGATKMGPRGDAIVQMDWAAGQVINELDRLGLADNTIIIFTSDNGPVLNDGYEDRSVELIGEHKPAGPYRGGKYSAFEAGTRVPMIVYWPKKIKAQKSIVLISQMDIYASLAKLLDINLAKNEAIDSQQLLSSLLGNSNQGRADLLEESVGPHALRSDQWKYISPKKGNNNYPWLKPKGIEGGFSAEPQLYDLGNDESEQNNIAEQHPKLILQFQQRIEQIVASSYHTEENQ